MVRLRHFSVRIIAIFRVQGEACEDLCPARTLQAEGLTLKTEIGVVNEESEEYNKFKLDRQ